MDSDNQRLGRVPLATLLLATVYGVALIVAGFVAPAYQSDGLSSSGEVTHSADTLVGVNGRGVVFVLAVPLVATLLVGCALWLHSRRGALLIAWTVTGLLAAFTLLALLSIGLFVLPVTAALIVACAASRPRRPPLPRLPADAVV